MARTTMSCAFAALLLSAPLVAVAAPPAGSPDRPAAAESMRLERSAASPGASAPALTAESAAPTTPMPLNLPDDATAEEVQSQYALGIATLVMATLVLAAIVIGALYVVARRTWVHPH